MKLVCIVVFSIVSFLYAQTSESPHVIDNGGGGASSSNYKQIASIGQAVIGIANSSSYNNQAGYITVSLGPYVNIGEKENDKVTFTFSLSQNYPNPFNSNTIIEFTLPEKSDIVFSVFNIVGENIYREMKSCDMGKFQITLEMSRFPSGMYFYELRTPKYIEKKKMLFLK